MFVVLAAGLVGVGGVQLIVCNPPAVIVPAVYVADAIVKFDPPLFNALTVTVWPATAFVVTSTVIQKYPVDPLFIVSLVNDANGVAVALPMPEAVPIRTVPTLAKLFVPGLYHN